MDKQGQEIDNITVSNCTLPSTEQGVITDPAAGAKVKVKFLTFHLRFTWLPKRPLHLETRGILHLSKFKTWRQAQVKGPQELSHLNETQGPKEHTDHLNEGYLEPFEV